MNYTFGMLLIALALLMFIMVANNSWMNLWDSLKQNENASGGNLDTPASTTGSADTPQAHGMF